MIVPRQSIHVQAASSDRQLHVTTFGTPTKHALLYLHGGPGVGAYDFEQYQGDRLGSSQYLVCLDQRGTLRSDPLDGDRPLHVEDLVEDCERVRIVLNIERMSLLGHSFGGLLAVRYAVRHPEIVESMILENPSLDTVSSARSLLGAMAGLYTDMGDRGSAQRCAEVSAEWSRDVWSQMITLMAGLGERRSALHLTDTTAHVFDAIVEASQIDPARWQQGEQMQQAIVADPAFYESLTEVVASLPCPVLVILGAFDHVTSQDQIDAMSRNPAIELVRFEHSAHFPHLEEPDRFADIVRRFLQSTPAPTELP